MSNYETDEFKARLTLELFIEERRYHRSRYDAFLDKQRAAGEKVPSDREIAIEILKEVWWTVEKIVTACKVDPNKF